MKILKDREIVLGVSGSIAAYKAVEIVRRLIDLGAQVKVIMTAAATKFVTPLTFQTISQNRVFTDMFAPLKEWEIEHISLGERASLFLIAPATANIIAKIAHGIADDLLSTTLLATKAPILIAPAMNDRMYENPVVQRNINLLRERGFAFIEPEYGQLVSGRLGKGRLASVDKIVEMVVETLRVKKDLSGKTILITAGPTQEPFDPVRYITNPSTGKMGYALAKKATARGAKVILISGPTYLEPPAGVEVVKVRTALQMREEVLKYFSQVDMAIKAAAVVDFKPKRVVEEKVKKREAELILELERNPDILAELGKIKGKRILVGFAAETGDIITKAKAKLEEKNLDLVVANDVTIEGAGFGSDTNIVTIITKGGKIRNLPQLSKEEVADRILDEIVAILNSPK